MLVIVDDRFENGEHRYHAIGMLGHKCLVLVHSYPDPDYRVRKKPISIRLDADVLDWLRTRHDRYQVEINRILRERMEAEAD